MRAGSSACYDMAMAVNEADVQTGEVDGVPVYSIGVDGPFTAGLIFGAAMWHEAPMERGLSHLVEHLALHGLGNVPYVHNGQVDVMGTTFFVRGEPGEAAEYLTRTARSLTSLPDDRIEQEGRVLAAESASRGASTMGTLAMLRWGLWGPGVIDLPEYALRAAKAETVNEWRDRRFGRGNAALWCSGPPPPSLDLSALHDAAAHRPPLPTPLVSEPCYDVVERPGFSAMATVGRSVVGPVGVPLLQTWLMDQVRHGAGSAYSVVADYVPVTADDALVLWTVDGPPDDLSSTLDAVLSALDELRTTGFSQAQLDLVRERARRGEAENRVALAAIAAANDLLGRDDVLDPSWRERAAALSAEEVTEEVVTWIDASQWLVPPTAMPPIERRLLPGPLHWKPEPVAGRPLMPHPSEPEPYAIHVGDDGVSLVYVGDTHLTVRFDELAVYRRYEEGIRVLHAYDGTSIVYDPDRWAESTALGDWLDAAASARGKLVLMGPARRQ